MKASAGRWLAVFACVAGAGIGLRSIDVVKTQVVDVAPAKNAAPRVRLAAMPATGAPQPFPIDARVMREAVRNGELQVALPDGSTQHVAIERQYTDSTGHWNVVGRTPTRLGKLPMVLTFGANAVFGTLPAPDGATMQVTTAPGGAVELNAPASRTDGERVATSTRADQPIEVQSRTTPSAAPAELAPAQIDLLAYYTNEQIALRGDVAAVETEFANLVAVANQAHGDSGSRARFNIVHFENYGNVDPATTDQAMLEYLNYLPSAETLRESWGADLVVLLRPANGDGMCGRSFSASPPLRRTETYGSNGQVIINGGGSCGPLAFAHETGHVLGAFDDRSASTSALGVLAQPAYYYAYGLRSYSFSTIMASPGGATLLPFFSNPDSTACNGMPCGIPDYVDDVRAFNAIAPVVATYRGVPGSISIADVEGVEGDYADNVVGVPVRYTGPDGSGPSFRFDVVGGTATRDVDYTIDTSQRWYATHPLVLPVTIKPDAQIEGDETIVLRIRQEDGLAIDKGEATITIVDEDPRPVVSGRVVFPNNIAPPTTPVTLTFLDFDAPGNTVAVSAIPPDFSFAVRPFRGKQLLPKIVWPAPFALPRMKALVNEVHASQDWVLAPQRGVRLWGTVRGEIDIGVTDPQVPPLEQLEATHYEGQDSWKEDLSYIPQRGNEFSIYVPVGSHATFRATPYSDYPYYKEGFLGMYDALEDHFAPMRLSPYMLSLNAWPAERTPANTTGAPVYLNGVNTQGVSFRCTTVDGTAKAGVDYVPMTAVVVVPYKASGTQYCGSLQVMPNNRKTAVWFEVEISEVANAMLHTSRARVTIPGTPVRTGGPSQASQ